MDYMIHTCNRRRGYVNKFLIPSMLDQGIKKSDITVAIDTHCEGNLLSTMKMFDYIGRTKGWHDITWHLQDDIVICSDFKQRTEELYGDIICGFCCKYDKSKKYGLVDREEMWYSFPCIGIKNKLVQECADWFFNKAVYDVRYKPMISTRKHDDNFFQYFLESHYPNIKAFNVRPNLVDHVDYLLGGSLANPSRKEKEIRAYYWTESEIVKKLESALL